MAKSHSHHLRNHDFVFRPSFPWCLIKAIGLGQRYVTVVLMIKRLCRESIPNLPVNKACAINWVVTWLITTTGRRCLRFHELKRPSYFQASVVVTRTGGGKSLFRAVHRSSQRQIDTILFRCSDFERFPALRSIAALALRLMLLQCYLWYVCGALGRVHVLLGRDDRTSFVKTSFRCFKSLELVSSSISSLVWPHCSQRSHF